MFYLKLFYQVIWDLKLRGISFLLLSVGLFTLAANRNQVKDFVAIKIKPKNPYFNALIDNKVNAQSIARKLKNLPGVVAVKVKSTDYLKKDLKTMVKQIDEKIVKNMVNISFQGLKVELDRTLEKNSQGLVQEYLNRLVGEQNITITGVKYPTLNIVSSNKGIRSIFMKWIDLFLIFCITIVWCFGCWTLSKDLKTRSYLVEKFQRKNMVASKSFLCGMSSLVFVVFNLTYFYDGDLSALMILMIPLLLVGVTFNTNHIKYLSTK